MALTAKANQYKGVFGTIATMVKNEGPKSLYNGLVAGLQRQMSFASVRIGLYDSVKQFYTKGSERKLPFYLNELLQQPTLSGEVLVECMIACKKVHFIPDISS